MSKGESIFLVMSYADEYYQVYSLFFHIATQRGIEAVRADEVASSIKKLRHGVFSKIRDAILVVVELSSGSPNVLYEAGWAHAMGKTTLLLAQDGVNIPFDLDDHHVVRYDPRLPRDARQRLQIEFDRHLAIARESVPLRQPLIEVLGTLEDIASRDDLFTHLLGRSIEHLAAESRKWTGDSIHVGAAEAIEKGVRVFQLLKTGGFATYLVPLNHFWTTDTPYLQECRNAAQRGTKIQRVFLLVNHESLFSASLRDHVRLDEAAGIEVTVAFVDDIPDPDAVQDFGIWDDQLLCLIEIGTVSGAANVKGCSFGRDQRSLARARAWRDSIQSVAQPAKELVRQLDALDQERKLLLRSAGQMRSTAQSYCRGSYLTANQPSCDWYHSAWQYLRLLGMVSSPFWHSDFYSKSFSAAVKDGVRDILISGTADYAILQHLVRALPSGASDVMISILDSCPTPLRMCRWWHEDSHQKEEREGQLYLRYDLRDALQTGYNDATYDLVTSDAFITRFDADQQRRLIAEWRRVVRKGGRVVTTARLGQSSAVTRVVGNEAEVANFVERTHERLTKSMPWLRPISHLIDGLTRAYAERFVSYPLPSESYLRDLFEGFVCEIEIGITQGELEGATRYARVVAIRQ